MGVEYHGWVALATSQAEWSDVDFDHAVREVGSLVENLSRERGHDPAMPDSDTLPRVVYLNGGDTQSALPAVRLLERIGGVFDKAYGEVVILADEGAQNEHWRFAEALRYRLVDGTLTKVEA